MQFEAVNCEPTGFLPDSSRCHIDSESDENIEYDEDFDLHEVVFERSRKLTIIEILSLLSLIMPQLWASNELPEDFCTELEGLFYRISKFAGLNSFFAVNFPWINYPKSFEQRTVFFFQLMKAAAESMWADYNDPSNSLELHDHSNTLYFDIRYYEMRIIYAARACEPWIKSASLNGRWPTRPSAYDVMAGSEVLKVGKLDQGTCGSAAREPSESGECNGTTGSKGSRGASSEEQRLNQVLSPIGRNAGKSDNYCKGREAEDKEIEGEGIENRKIDYKGKGKMRSNAPCKIIKVGSREAYVERPTSNKVVDRNGRRNSGIYDGKGGMRLHLDNARPSKVAKLGTSSASSAQPTLDQATCGSADSESRKSGACNGTAGSEDSSGGKRGASSEERCLNQALSQNGSKPNEPDPRNVTPGSEVLKVGTSSASLAQPALNQVVSPSENESQESGPHDSMAGSTIREAELLTLGQVAPSYVGVGRSQGRRTSEGIVGNPQSGRSDNDPSTDLDVAISTGGPPLGVTSGIVRFVSQGYHDCLSEVLGNPSLWVFSIVPICWIAKTFVNMATSATAVMVCSTVLQAFCESWPYIAAWILYIVYTSRSTKMARDTSPSTNTRSFKKTAMIANVAYGVAVITLITLFSTHLRSLGNTRTEVSMGVKVARFDVSFSVSVVSSRSTPFSIPNYKQLFAAHPTLAGNTVRGISTQYQWIKSLCGATPVSVPTPVAWYGSTVLHSRYNCFLSYIAKYLSIGGSTPVSVPTPVAWYGSTVLLSRYSCFLSFIAEYLAIGGSTPVSVPAVWCGFGALHAGIVAFCLFSQSTCLLASIPTPPWPDYTAIYAGHHCILSIITKGLLLKGVEVEEEGGLL